MSVTKKWPLVVIIVFVIVSMAFAVGCGGSKSETASSTSSGGNESKETVAEAKVKGEIYDTEKFSILAPDGWNKMDIPGGVQLYQGNDVLQVAVSGSNITEEDDKALLEDMSKQYNGTPLEEVSMFGMKFFKISFTASGSDQTMYSGVRNGEQVIIQVAGKDHANNETIKAMLESIKLK